MIPHALILAMPRRRGAGSTLRRRVRVLLRPTWTVPVPPNGPVLGSLSYAAH